MEYNKKKIRRTINTKTVVFAWTVRMKLIFCLIHRTASLAWDTQKHCVLLRVQYNGKQVSQAYIRSYTNLLADWKHTQNCLDKLHSHMEHASNSECTRWLLSLIFFYCWCLMCRCVYCSCFWLDPHAEYQWFFLLSFFSGNFCFSFVFF